MSHKVRPRMLYPSLWDSEKFFALDGDAFKVWAFLLSQADDEGRGQLFVPIVASRPFLKSPKTLAEAARLVQTVASAGLCCVYEIDGRRYYQMHDWEDYQKIRKDRIEPSTYPPPPENEPKQLSLNVVPNCQPSGNQVATNCQPTVGLKCSVSVSDSVSDSGNGNGKAARGAAGGQADHGTATIPYDLVVTDLNEIAQKTYRSDSEATRQLIRARWSEGYRLADFQRVHRNMKQAASEGSWAGTERDMTVFLRPSTLYRPSHFESYLNWSRGRRKSELDLIREKHAKGAP